MHSFRLFLLLMFSITLAGCGLLRPAFQSPELVEQETAVESLSFSEVTMAHTFEIRNNQSSAARITGIDYAVYLNETDISRGKIESARELDRNATEQLRIPFSISFQNLIQYFGVLPERETLPYKLVTITESVPSDREIEVPLRDTLEFRGEFPLLQEPVIAVDTLMLKSFNLAIAELELRVRIVNPNSIPVTVDNIDVTLSVDGTAWHNQKLSQAITVPARSDVVFDAPFSMRPRQFDTSVYRNLNMEQAFEYRLAGSARAAVDYPGFVGPHNWTFHGRGQQQFERLGN